MSKRIKQKRIKQNIKKELTDEVLNELNYKQFPYIEDYDLDTDYYDDCWHTRSEKSWLTQENYDIKNGTIENIQSQLKKIIYYSQSNSFPMFHCAGFVLDVAVDPNVKDITDLKYINVYIEDIVDLQYNLLDEDLRFKYLNYSNKIKNNQFYELTQEEFLHLIEHLFKLNKLRMLNA